MFRTVFLSFTYPSSPETLIQAAESGSMYDSSCSELTFNVNKKAMTFVTVSFKKNGLFSMLFHICIICEKTAGAACVGQRQFSPSSKMDVLLPRTEPVSNAGGASLITYLKGKNHCAVAVRVRK